MVAKKPPETAEDRVELGGEGRADLAKELDSGASWLLHLPAPQPARLTLRVSSRGAVAVLAARDSRPSLLNWELLDSAGGAGAGQLSWDLAAGTWQVQLSNEQPWPQELLVSLTTDQPADLQPCPDCILVRGLRLAAGPAGCLHGSLGGSGCHCEPGWLGPHCDTRREECGAVVCGGRGECRLGPALLGYPALHCDCQPGWGGPHCGEADCPGGCGVGGTCQAGVCRCFTGWEGVACNTTKVHTEVVCPELVVAVEPACQQDCGPGQCQAGRCVCPTGWAGPGCRERECQLCSQHGECDTKTGRLQRLVTLTM